MRLVVAAVVLASLFAQPASAAAPAAGAAGIGDSYFPYAGNGGYDVLHYDVNLRYQPATDELVGMTRLTARTTQRLARFNLDFALDVESVTVDGRAAAFARAGAHELVVAPARPTGAGQVMTVIVRYAGVPSTVVVDGRTAWTRTADGAVAVGEPAVAWWWFPSNDHPRDKATFDVSVRVPDGFEAITNGVPVRVPATSPPGWAIWSWHTGVPMATYLAFLAIGEYDIQASSAPDGRPVVTAFADGLGDSDAGARESVGRTVGIATWASTMFGPYPFDVYGGIVVPAGAAPFSLEAQGRPVYPADAFQFGANDFVVVHELAHQWFGDSVSLTGWRDIWLNEGFATYAEWLWAEHIGLVTANEVFDVSYGAMPADDPFWSVVIGDPGPDRLLDDAVYTRGAMTLHQLRSTIGDPTFFTILRAWTASHRYGNATTEQFVDLASRLSGRDLRPLFMRWLFEPRRPPAVRPVAPRVV